LVLWSKGGLHLCVSAFREEKEGGPKCWLIARKGREKEGVFSRQSGALRGRKKNLSPSIETLLVAPVRGGGKENSSRIQRREEKEGEGKKCLDCEIHLQGGRGKKGGFLFISPGSQRKQREGKKRAF